MWVLIVIGVIFIWILKDVLVGKPNSELSKSRKDKLYYSCNYCGGFDDVSIKYSNVDVVFNEDDITFNFHKGYDIDITKTINYNDLRKVKFMNETTISQEISLGRMVCFGWLGLAMKKEKKNIKEYVVIETKHENENISIVLDAAFNQNERLLNEIKNRINNYS